MSSVPITRPKGSPVVKRIPLTVTIPLPALESIGLHLSDLRYGSCRYIISTVRGVENVQYCGAESSRGAYCAYHARLCYQPPAKRVP